MGRRAGEREQYLKSKLARVYWEMYSKHALNLLHLAGNI